MLSFFALLALLPVCLVVSARHRWPRTPAKCSARICDAARSLRQRCGAVFYVGHPEGPSFLGVARAPRPRVCCIGGLRCARRSFEIIIYIENDAFWGRSVGAGLGPEVVLGGRVPCSLRLVGLVRACVGQEVVVCVCLLCRLLRGQTHLSMHSAVGRVGAGVVLGVMVGVLFSSHSCGRSSVWWWRAWAQSVVVFAVLGIRQGLCLFAVRCVLVISD